MNKVSGTRRKRSTTTEKKRKKLKKREEDNVDATQENVEIVDEKNEENVQIVNKMEENKKEENKREENKKEENKKEENKKEENKKEENKKEENKKEENKKEESVQIVDKKNENEMSINEYILFKKFRKYDEDAPVFFNFFLCTRNNLKYFNLLRDIYMKLGVYNIMFDINLDMRYRSKDIESFYEPSVHNSVKYGEGDIKFLEKLLYELTIGNQIQFSIISAFDYNSYLIPGEHTL